MLLLAGSRRTRISNASPRSSASGLGLSGDNSSPFSWKWSARNAAVLAFENLDEGKATVGFEVCVKHVAAAPEGKTCSVSAKLREVVDRRKLRFDVEVKEGERTIGVGTHERRGIAVGGMKQD